MAFDVSRLRTDQLLRLNEVDYDLSKLGDDELVSIIIDSQEEYGALGSAFERVGATLKQAGLGAFAELTDDKELADEAQQDYQRTLEELALRAPEREVPSIAEVYDEEGLFGAISDFPTFAYESIIETIPPLLGVGAASIAGGLVGGPRGAIAAGVSTSTALETAFNIAAQAEEQGVGLDEVDYEKALLFGTAQGALEFLPVAKFGQIIKKFGKTEADTMLVSELKRNPLLQRGKQALQFGAGGAALEGLTEAAQESLSLIQAAPTIEEGMEILASLSPEVKNQLIDAGFAGAGVGGTIGTATGALRPTGAITEADIQRDLEASLAEENLSALQMQAFAEGAKPAPKKKAGEQTLEEAVDEVTAAQEAVAQEESRTLDDIEQEVEAPPVEGFMPEEMVVQADMGNGVILPLKKAEADILVEQGLLDENYDYIEEVDNEKLLEYVDSLINDVQQQIEVEQPETKMEESVASPQSPKYMILRKGPDGKDVTQSVTEEELTEQEKLEMIDAGVVVAEDFKNPPVIEEPVIEEPVVEEPVVEEAVVEEEVAPEDDLPKAFKPENIMGTLKSYAEGNFENGLYYAHDVLMTAVKQDPSLRPLVELRVGSNDNLGVWRLAREIDQLESKTDPNPLDKKDLRDARSQLTKILRGRERNSGLKEQNSRNALAKLLELTKQGAEPVVQEEATPDIVIEEPPALPEAVIEDAVEQETVDTTEGIAPEGGTFDQFMAQVGRILSLPAVGLTPAQQAALQRDVYSIITDNMPEAQKINYAKLSLITNLEDLDSSNTSNRATGSRIRAELGTLKPEVAQSLIKSIEGIVEAAPVESAIEQTVQEPAAPAEPEAVTDESLFEKYKREGKYTKEEIALNEKLEDYDPRSEAIEIMTFAGIPEDVAQDLVDSAILNAESLRGDDIGKVPPNLRYVEAFFSTLLGYIGDTGYTRSGKTVMDESYERLGHPLPMTKITQETAENRLDDLYSEVTTTGPKEQVDPVAKRLEELASLRGKKKTKYGMFREKLSDSRFMVFAKKDDLTGQILLTLVDPQTGLVIEHSNTGGVIQPYFREVREGGKLKAVGGMPTPNYMYESTQQEAIAKTKEDITDRPEVYFVLAKESRTGSKGRIVPEGMLQRAREAWKTTSTKEYDAKIKDVMKSLEQRLKKLGLTDVQLKSRNIIGKIEDGVVEGESMINQKAAKSVITLATRLYDPSLDQQTLEAKLGSVMNHEIIHSLVDLGLLSPEEIQILSRNAAKIRYVDDKGNKRLFSFLDRAKSLYPKASEQLQQEEAVAEMFRAWAEGKLKVPGAQQTYFQRIVNFFKELFGAHKDNGFTDVEDIFQAIEEGSVGARERVIREEDGAVSKEARKGPRKIGDRIVGAPPNQTAEKDRQNLVRRMFRYMESPLAVAEKSKDWYERSGETIRSITRGDPELMEKTARLMALYSQGNSVGGNTTAVIKSIYQLASGQDTAFAGRFPETTAKRIPDLLAAPVFDQSVEGVSDKIENFYRNLIDPAKGVDTYADASTMDKWMMRLMGYKVADDEDVGGASALSPTQYAYARDIMDRLVSQWTRKTGERLKPRQVQAILWTYVKNKAEQDKIKDPDKRKAFQPKVVDFNDYMVRATAHITWEARPSESLPILDWIHTAPREVQEQWNETVREVLTNPDGSDKVMSLFPSEQLYNSGISTGAYEGKIAPNVISRIVLRKDDNQYLTDIANQYASIMGYILKQDAVPWYRPDAKGGKLDSVGYDVSFNVDLTQELEQELFAHLDGLIPNIGYTKVDGNLQFINFRDENGKPMSGVADKKFEAQLVEALQSFPQEIDFSVTPFRAQSNYIFNDWTENQNGESYIESFGRREFADIQETVDGWATEISNAADIFDARRDELLNLDRTGAEQADVRARGGKRYSGKQSRKGYPQYESGRLGPAKGRSAFDVYHYSAQDGIDFLDSNKHGSGKAGLELKRGWKPRVFFYVQQEAGRPRPEMVLRRMKNGYGAYLTNIYDPIKSRYILDEVKAKNNGVLNVDMMEDMIEAEGYDGYIAWSFQPTPAIVLLGENNVPVIQEMRNGEKLDSESALAQPKQSRRGDFTPSAEYAAIMNRVVARQNQDRPLGKLWDKIFGRVGNETYNQAFIRNVVNKYFPAFMLDQAAYGTMITDIDSVGRAMENAEQITGRLDALWNIGAFRYDRNTSEIEFVDEADNRGLYAIFDRIGEQNKEKFHVYSIARRERDLRVNSRQGMTNMTDDEINNIIAEAPNFFEEVFEDYQQFNKRMVQFAVDAGIIEPSKAVDLVNMAYVPFYREMEADANDPMSEAEIIGPRASAALKNPRAFNIKIKGGDAPIGDFYENIVRNQEAILSASLRNIALQKTASALEVLNAQGVNSWGRRATSVDKENVITVRYDGKSKRYKIDDASLWVSIANMNPKQQHALIQIGAMFGGILRSGITLFPGFMLANLIRGKVDGFVKTGVTLNPLSTLRGGLDEFREGELTAELKAKTGIGGYTYGMGTKNFANTVKSKYRRGEMFKNPTLRSVGDALSGLKEGLERVGEATEFAERVALYEQLLNKGVSKREAAYKAMNLINFGRRGAGQGLLGATFLGLIPVVPFLNARIQGLYRLFENEQAQGKPSIIPPMEMLIRGSIITAASAGMYLLSADDDRWDEEPVYRKVNYDIFYIGDQTIYIPRAFEVGSIFGAIPVLAMDAIKKEDARDLWQGTREIFFNTLAFNPIPAAVRPSLEVMTNYDFFTGRSVESLGLQGMEKQDRFYETTPYFYRVLADLSRDNPFLPDFSPLQAQQIIEGHLGSLSTAFVATADVVFSGSYPQKPSGTFGDPYSPTAMAASLTGVNRFIKDDSERTTRYVSEFYDLKRDIDAIHYSLKRASLAGDNERVNELLEEKGTAYGYRSQVNRVGRQLQKINAQIRAIMVNPDLTSSQKAEYIQPLREARNNLTRQVVQAAMQADLY